jgi:hypothetical protein
VATKRSARTQRLSGRAEIRNTIRELMQAVRAGVTPDAEARRAGALLLDAITELNSHTRMVVSADGEEHELPFELLARASGKPLLESHVVSYVPSGSALATLRTRSRYVPERIALAVSASPATAPRPSSTGPNQAAIGTVARGV